MQGGHNPSRIQKKKLTDNGKNSKEWLYIKTNAVGELVFKHKTSGEILTLPNN